MLELLVCIELEMHLMSQLWMVTSEGLWTNQHCQDDIFL